MKKRIIAMLLVIAMLLSTCQSVFAISVEGGSGSGAGIPDGSAGSMYAVSSDNCIGYRFSIVDARGIVISDNAIKDIFMTSTYNKRKYIGVNGAIRCKTEISNAYNNNVNMTVSTHSRATGGWLDSSDAWKKVGLDFELRSPKYIMKDIENDINDITKKILKRLGISSGTKGLGSQNKLIIEPLYAVYLNGHSLTATVTDMVVYGIFVHGGNENCPSPSASGGKWGYIVEATNDTWLDGTQALLIKDDETTFGWWGYGVESNA